jgi:lysophospholipase L1-like esterase
VAHRTVLCFGDSNTYGSIPGEAGGRFAADIRWPGVLARELGDGWQVVEEGLPGRTTVFDDPLAPYRRGADDLPPCLASHAPLDAVVIFLGTNDLKAHLAAGAPAIAAGVGVLAQTVLASGAGPRAEAPRVLLLGLPRLGAPLGLEFSGAEQKTTDLPRYLAREAAAIGVELLDLADVVTYSVLDEFHLDAAGHTSVGEVVARRLAAMF